VPQQTTPPPPHNNNNNNNCRREIPSSHEEKPPPHSLRNSLAIAQKPLDGFRLRNAKEITRAAIAWHGKWTEKTRQNHDARKNQQGGQARRLQREATQNRTEQSRTHFLLTLFVCLVACGAMHRFFYVRNFAKMREIKRGIFCGNIAHFFWKKIAQIPPQKKKKTFFFVTFWTLILFQFGSNVKNYLHNFFAFNVKSLLEC
jgi:hypothetical protein